MNKCLLSGMLSVPVMFSGTYAISRADWGDGLGNSTIIQEAGQFAPTGVGLTATWDQVTMTTASEGTVKFMADSEWKKVDMSNVQVKAGSALDLSAVSAVGVPGENHLPRLTIGPSGRLTAEGNPNDPLRLHGSSLMNLNEWLKPNSTNWKEEMRSLVSLARLQGYNLLRVFYVDGISPERNMDIQPELLDRVDYLISQMGQQGVYMYLPIFTYRYYIKSSREVFYDRNDYKARMYLGDPLLRGAWEYAVNMLMSHVNPYTGLAWKDDPVIACVEFFNEQSAGIPGIGSGIKPGTLAMFDEQFRQWLEVKYKEPTALADAWRDVSITSFDQISNPGEPINKIGSTPKEKDVVLFYNELYRKNIDWYEQTIRVTGYQGLAAQYNKPSQWFGSSHVKFEKSQVSILNRYFNHPSNQSNPGSETKQNSSIGTAADYWRGALAVSRFPDRPLFVSEFNHPFGNPYQHEGGLLFGSYSGFQGIDALVVHQGAAVLEVNKPNDAWSVGSNPVARANEFLLTCLYLRGDVTPSPHRVDLEIPQSYMGDMKRISSEQDKIGLLTGFSITFPWSERPQGVASPVQPDMILPAESSHIYGGRPRNSEFSIDALVTKMKEKGMLSNSNISAPSEGIFQNDTEEIIMRTQENLIKVKTGMTEAVSLEAGKSEQIGLLNVKGSTTRATIATSSIDNQPLASSSRIVLIYSTEIANTGMELSADRVTMLKLGTLPVLMKAGKLEATLKNPNGAKMSLYALGFDGSRREKLPVVFADGLLKININTADLKDGPTPFFELATK